MHIRKLIYFNGCFAITIPKPIEKALGLKRFDHVQVFLVKGGIMLLKKHVFEDEKNLHTDKLEIVSEEETTQA